MMTNMKKARIITNGCPENRIDSANMKTYLENNNWEISSSISDSDLIIINTCGLSEFSKQDSINIIKEAKHYKKQTARLLVCGCLPKINLSLLREHYSGQVFGSDDLRTLKNILKSDIDIDTLHTNYLIPKYSLPEKFSKKIKSLRIEKLFSLNKIIRKILRIKYHKFYHKIDNDLQIYDEDTYCIKISTGCLNSCAFCAVKKSRGHLKSKQLSNILEEFKDGLAMGFKNFSFIGTDLGAYGRDLGINLALLLKEIVKIEGDYSIKLRNVNPKYLIPMMPELIEVLNSGKIAQIGSAVESGNDRILSIMNRGYSIDEYKKVIAYINYRYPNIKVRTQFLVGFPGETDEEFQDTLNLIEELRFDFIEFYNYSSRPNTAAAVLSGQVPEHISLNRYNKLYRKFVLEYYNPKSLVNSKIRIYENILQLNTAS